MPPALQPVTKAVLRAMTVTQDRGSALTQNGENAHLVGFEVQYYAETDGGRDDYQPHTDTAADTAGLTGSSPSSGPLPNTMLKRVIARYYGAYLSRCSLVRAVILHVSYDITPTTVLDIQYKIAISDT